MIEYLELKNWKSFVDSKVYIEQLTFMIGVNASGKSNVLDALGFLSQLSSGRSVSDCAHDVRGGEDWIIRNGGDSFTLSVKVHDDETVYDYYYSVTVAKRNGRFEVCREELSRNGRSAKIVLFATGDKPDDGQLLLSGTTYTAKKGNRRKIELFREKLGLAQLEHQKLQKDVNDGVQFVAEKLRLIYTLNPMTQNMRGYSALSSELKRDASNIAGVIAGMKENDRKVLQNQIAKYVRPLPERDIKSVWSETVGLFDKDAMLYCTEEWTDSKEMTLDARGMSDGTLRFIAIVTALLTLPKGTLLLIEEVDNGLHPSRADELVKALVEIGEQRGLDVLCTTHNPVLIDELGNGMIPNICYVTRSEENGASEVRLLEDRVDLARLLSGATVGSLMTKGRI